jgi:hypothetical protein
MFVDPLIRLTEHSFGEKPARGLIEVLAFSYPEDTERSD